MQSNSVTIHKLQKAINMRFGAKILLNRSQFYSEQQDRPVTVYYVKQSIPQSNGRNRYIELFKSTSEIQILLFLRDMWYELNGWEVPTDNAKWNAIKKSMEDSNYGKHQEDTDSATQEEN